MDNLGCELFCDALQVMVSCIFVEIELLEWNLQGLMLKIISVERPGSFCLYQVE